MIFLIDALFWDYFKYHFTGCRVFSMCCMQHRSFWLIHTKRCFPHISPIQSVPLKMITIGISPCVRQAFSTIFAYLWQAEKFLWNCSVSAPQIEIVVEWAKEGRGQQDSCQLTSSLASLSKGREAPEWPNGRMSDWPTGRLTDWQTDKLSDWQTGLKRCTNIWKSTKICYLNTRQVQKVWGTEGCEN